MKYIFSVTMIIVFFISCNAVRESQSIPANTMVKKDLSNEELQFWYSKDFQEDNIPGISLDKWYKRNKKRQKSKNIIVAVLDTQLDIEHEDLKDHIWINPNEIPDNGIDDDKNGYIDDVHGWSFIGTKCRGFFTWSNFEYVRFIKEWDVFFTNKTDSQIETQNLGAFKEYKRALQMLEKNEVYYKNWLKSLQYSVELYPQVKDTLKYFFPKEDYTYNQLDSLYQKYKINDKTFRQRREDNDLDLGALIGFMKFRFEFNEKTLEDVKESKSNIDSVVNRNLNMNYDERTLIGDNPKVLEKGYGNNKINLDKKLQSHNTKVSGIIAANRENREGVKGISSEIRIMPLNISCSGDEHDKDIAMAIRYAVDNGAKVINMSFGKEFSLHKEWVNDAYKYAEVHNVLIVHSAGNNGWDIDENSIYPNDINYDGLPEVCSNFITVGSISHRMDSTFVSSFSNYGKQNVDLFAPGEDIYTTIAGGGYDYDSGTSLAGPMVSGTAALIWLYYPKLTASEVKQIIMESGAAYDLLVVVPGTKDKKVHFSELSKSGKVLNVYKAMTLAEKRYKRKP